MRHGAWLPLAMLLLFFVGCTGSPADSTDSVPLGNGADSCEEASRSAVVDPADPADGFTFAAADLLAAFARSWAGTWAAQSGSTDASLDLAWTDGGIEAVTYTLHQDTGGAMQGAPSADCSSQYEIAVGFTTSTADGALNEVGAVTLIGAAADAASFHADIDIGAVGGTTRPSGWLPEDWASNTLSLDGAGTPEQLQVSATWHASSAPSGPAVDSGAPTDTGTMSPSGMTEGAGSMTLTPVP